MTTIEEEENKKNKTSSSSTSSREEEKEEIKRFVDWAISMNPLVYKRLAEI